jgi:L-fuconolactonase
MVQVRNEADGLAEAERIAGIARTTTGIKAMVGGNVAEDPGRRAELDALHAIPLVRGIRRGTQFHPDPLYLARPEMIDGFRKVAELGLVPEVCVKHFQLEGVIALAKALPEARIVLDHLGKPEMITTPQPEWRAKMAELARYPGVAVKVSVVLQQPDDPPLSREAVGPIVREVVELFGWDRVVFGSNWPVSTLLIGYREWVELLVNAFPDATEDELDRLFYRNAARTWGVA